MKTRLFITNLFATLILGLIPLSVQAAGSATLSLSPASGNHMINTGFTVSVYENSGAIAVNAVEADLIYDASVLKFVSLTTTVGAFDLCLPQTSNGSIEIPCAKSGAKVSGSQLVAQVTFKGLSAPNTSSVTFGAGSYIGNGDGANLWNGNTAGGSYTIAPTPSSGSGGNTGSSTTTPPANSDSQDSTSTRAANSDSSTAANNTQVASAQDSTPVATADNYPGLAATSDADHLNTGNDASTTNLMLYIIYGLLSLVIGAMAVWRKTLLAKTTNLFGSLKKTVIK